MNEIILKAKLMGQLHDKAMAARPSEAVGLLVGAPNAPSTAWQFEPLVNEVDPPQSYRRCEISAGQWWTVMTDLELDELEVKAWWHSHPATAAVPSDTDHGNDDVPLCLITTGGDIRYESQRTRAWRMQPGERAIQIPIDVEP